MSFEVLLHDKEITLQLRGKGLAVTRSGKITFNKLTVKKNKKTRGLVIAEAES